MFRFGLLCELRTKFRLGGTHTGCIGGYRGDLFNGYTANFVGDHVGVI